MFISEPMNHNRKRAFRFLLLTMSLTVAVGGCAGDPAVSTPEPIVERELASGIVSKEPTFVSSDLHKTDIETLFSVPYVDKTAALATDCCSEPGKIEECWLVDAEDDGVACSTNSGCPSGLCDTDVGLCTCTTNSECRAGICTADHLCGPSWCNGIRRCSCSGGCEKVDGDEAYGKLCEDNAMSCCEGAYPIHPDNRGDSGLGVGYCSEDETCGTPCEIDADCRGDGNACTTERCDSSTGVCTSEPTVCDDANPCTDDSCDTWTGCVYANNTSSCDDSDACTEGDICADGVCSGTAVVCVDGNICTDDACDAVMGCVFENNAASCDDGDECTVDDTCAAGSCVGAVRNCSDGNVCTDDSCDPGVGCEYAFNTGSCDDANACTTADVCVNGSCQGGAPPDCGDGNPCTDNSCDPAVGCVSTNNTDPCDDDDACTAGDVCADGACTGSTAITCNDNNICTDDSCDPALGCRFEANTDVCDDGDACTVNDRCSDGDCLGTPADCDDSSVCTTDSCNSASGCVHVSDAMDCDDDNPCTNDSCDALLGCVNTPNTDSCDDGSACTAGDSCLNGACSGTAVSCDDGDPCTDDTCDPDTGCAHANNTASCDDLDVCTGNDVCSAGLCQGTVISCDDGNVCTDDSCDPSTGCRHVSNTESCDDGNLCTENDMCDSGSCGGTPVDCDDGDLCTEDTCNPSTGCVNTAIDPCYDCLTAADCEGQITCSPGPVGCSEMACDAGSCVCDPVAEGNACSDYSVADYPPNCYHGACDAAGGCQPTMHSASNNLCSDAFVSGDSSTVDTTVDTYIGEFANTDGGGTLLSVTGSTLCAENNYYAGGPECTEYTSGNAIGENGRDLVYVFRYQANAVDQFDMYSFIIKVEADYDIGMYIVTDVTNAAQCPEGNNPELDSHDETYLEVSSERCSYPYQSSPMPPVTEDECRDNGNTLNDQDCCDPCIDGSSCGYKWCKRGYNLDGSSCDMCAGAGGAGYDSMSYTGSCDALWTYPENPHNCDSETPADTGYSDYNYMASTIISPHGITDGEWHNVFVFIDGVSGDQGNFYLSIEKRQWWAGPCDRVNDDARVYDVTDVGSTGETFQGTLEGVVNSVHSGSGSCGGYSCASLWSGRSSCHQYATPSEFWPNQELFKIQRSSAQGSATYCITTDESISNAADLVSVVSQRRYGALTICDESYSTVGCERNNLGNNIQWEFEADPNELYLIEFSQYQKIDRVCSPAAGDNCRYRITVRAGECCKDPSTWYGGGLEGTITIDGSSFSPSSVISGSTSGASKNHDPGSGWNGRDELWQIDVTADARVRFSGCNDGGSGSYNAQMALYNCAGQMVAEDNDGCSSGGMPRFTVDLETASAPYYLVIDGYSNSNAGEYSIGMSYQ